jgi:HK97 gp10 family phage protein
MASPVEVKLTGFKELNDILVQMGEDLCYAKTARRVLIPAVKAAMQPVLQSAKLLVPFDENNTSTKHLRDTIKLYARVPTNKDQRSMYADKNAVAIGVVSVLSDKRALSQEFGNAQVSGQPYIRPALESNISRVLNILGAFLTYKLTHYKSRK